MEQSWQFNYPKEIFKNTGDLTKIPRVPWDENRDNLFVVVPEINEKFITKRNAVSKFIKKEALAQVFSCEFCEISQDTFFTEYLPTTASIYFFHLQSTRLDICQPYCKKGSYRELCDKKLHWDPKIPQILKKNIKKWVNDITKIPIKIPRSIPTNKKSITSVDLHVFGDASVLGNCAAVYAAVIQVRAIGQDLVASKFRISKRDLAISRLELDSIHMAYNQISNVKSALEN